MYWQEKVDHIALRFAATDFNRHFKDWFEILKTLEDRFIVKSASNVHFSNWSETFKSPILIRTINGKAVSQEMDRLDLNCNYWVVLVHGDHPTAKQVVYDCKPMVIEALIKINTGYFFIGDKKYNWLVQFKPMKNNMISLVKSGQSLTPFENKFHDKSGD
jgi:hypothetical protein